MKCGKRVCAAALTALLAIAGAASAQQQAYPVKPIRLIVPYPPGGTTSTFARLVGEKITASWGYNVIVDNRPGGNTIIGTEALTRAVADGHTIMFMDSAHVINPSLVPHLPYTAIRDFSPIGTLASTELLLAVHPSVPASTLKEFIAWAKTKPAQLNYASSGAGSVSHLSSELLNMIAGVSLVHVPYKGAAAALTDLIGGHVQMYFAAPISAIPHIKGGKLKAIAVPGEARLAALPQLPTFTESGIPSFSSRNWYGVLAPGRTPKPVVSKLSGEVARILALADVRERLSGMGMTPFVNTPDQFASIMHSDMAKFAKIIKSANIKLESY
jgi:tripartite-type tricarboxylate transporter receptor subunit TctC